MKRVIDLLDGIDWGTYYTFQFYTERMPGLHNLMIWGDWLGSYVAVAILLALSVIISPSSGRVRTTVVIAIAFAIGSGLVVGVKHATHRMRPPDAQKLLDQAELSRGFPSGTVLLGTFGSLLLAVGCERRIQRAAWRLAPYTVASVVIVFICVSQLWLGLNFVTDVLAGLAGGIALALTARWAATTSAAGVGLNV
jgi:undecaprenyl-diphosphatase